MAITGNFAAGQGRPGVLPNPQSGITGSFDTSTGVLTLTGTASPAAYQAVLRSVTYFNTSTNPSTKTRTVTFSVTDGAASDNTRLRDPHDRRHPDQPRPHARP